MTVIAFDGWVLAGDKRTSFGGLHGIHRIGDCLVGCSGTTAHIAEMLEWVRNGRKPEELPPHQRDPKGCASMLLIESDGTVLQYESSPYPIRIENKKSGP